MDLCLREELMSHDQIRRFVVTVACGIFVLRNYYVQRPSLAFVGDWMTFTLTTASALIAALDFRSAAPQASNSNS